MFKTLAKAPAMLLQPAKAIVAQAFAKYKS